MNKFRRVYTRKKASQFWNSMHLHAFENVRFAKNFFFSKITAKYSVKYLTTDECYTREKYRFV